MATVNRQGYLERVVKSGKINPRSQGAKRNWWIVKQNKYGTGIVNLQTISFSPHLVGKKVRFKAEIIEDEN